MTGNSDYRHLSWVEYLDMIEARHGKAARALAEKHGSAEAGDAAEIRRRQRISRNNRRVQWRRWR